MRAIFIILAILLCSRMPLPAQALETEPVRWSFDARQVAEREYELIYTARVDVGWYLYSQKMESELGPVPTTIVYDQPEAIELLGEARESGGRVEKYDPVFDMELVKFKNEAVFTQRVRFSETPTAISGYIEYMCCDNEKCLPPKEVPFRFEW